MFRGWLRKGSFNDLCEELSVTNRVTFLNTASPYVRQIWVERLFNKKLILHLVVAPERDNKVFDDCKAVSNIKFNQDQGFVEFTLDLKTLDTLVILFKKWKIYDEDLCLELNRLCRGIVHHVIPEIKPAKDSSFALIRSNIMLNVASEYRNLQRRAYQTKNVTKEIVSFSKILQYENNIRLFEQEEYQEFSIEFDELIETYKGLISKTNVSVSILLEKLLDEILQMKLRAYLHAFVDPNQLDIDGRSLLYLIDGNVALTVLMEYDCNPLIRKEITGNFISPFDIALMNKDIEKLKIFSMFLSKPQKSLATNYISSFWDDKKFSTDVILKTGEEFQATMKKSEKLGGSEKQYLAELHAQSFRSKNFIKDILEDKSNFVEVIKKNKRIVGFNVYQMVWSEEMEQPVFHWMYIVKDKQFKGKEVLQKLGFLRMGMLKLEGLTGPATHQGYKVINGLKLFPKWELPGKRDRCKKALSAIYGDLSNLTRRGTWYVTEPDYVEMRTALDYRETYFQKFVLGYQGCELDKGKMIRNNRVGIVMFDTNNTDITDKIDIHQKILDSYLDYATAPLRKFMLSELSMLRSASVSVPNNLPHLSDDKIQIQLRSKL